MVMYITTGGYKALKDEFDHLKSVERPKVVNEVAEAAAQGDRSENAEYIYAIIAMCLELKGSYINPIIYGIGMYAFADCLLHLPEFLRDTHNRRIFAARYRIGKDIGAIRESGRVLAWDEYYKHDYGKELPIEELEKE